MIARSGHLPRDLDIVEGADSPLVMYTMISDPPLAIPAGVEVTRMPARELTPTAALAHARRERGVRTVLYEGGSGMFGALLGSDCVDDLFLTVDSRLAADPEQKAVHECQGFDRLGLQRAWRDQSGHATLLHLRPGTDHGP